MPRLIRRWALASLSAGLSLAALVACGAAAPQTPTASPTPTGPAVIPATDITPILATTQLRIGKQRVAFLLESSTQLVTTPMVRIATSHTGGNGEMATAPFREWPYGTRGSYATELSFDQPGKWLLKITSDGIDGTVGLTVNVTQTSVVADIGQLAPFSNTKTIASVNGDLSKLTSASQPDPSLYQKSIVDAIISGMPTVVVFASPAFCTSPTCGPEVDTVSKLSKAYQGEANFIHVEIYDNPDEIQGDLSKAKYSPYLDQWGIDKIPGYNNESWTFVIGRDGRITQRFEGYATYDEIQSALLQALS